MRVRVRKILMKVGKNRRKSETHTGFWQLGNRGHRDTGWG